MRKVIHPYNVVWPALFEAEAAALRCMFAEAVIALHHVGSTAVPGLVAKPVIDILAEATCLDRLDECAPEVRARGYEVRGAYGIEGRRYFNKKPSEGDKVGFHVHAFASGSPQISRHIRFRDYLIDHPDVATQYAILKRSLSDANGVLAPDYVERKAPFVERIDRLALEAASRQSA